PSRPWPLQEFWPLQALWALLQADWPLQAFTPAHWVLASVPATAVLIRPVPKSMAAAVATARPELVFNCIVHSSCCEDLAGCGPTGQKTGARGDWSLGGL